MRILLRLLPLLALVAVLPQASEDSAEASFPGTNGRIAISNFTNNDVEIWTMNGDGGDRVKITMSAEDSNTQPSFSPDGTMIGFRRNSFGGGALFVVDAGGGDPDLIPNTEDAFEMAWAPDGNQVAFTRMLGPSAVFKMNLDGTGNTNLTADAPTFAESSPDWSPLGDKIAYIASSFGGTDIHVMNTDGSGKTNVTNTPEVVEGNPDFSPDGQRFVFDVITPAVVGASGQAERDIAVINVDGTGFELIKDEPALDQFDPAFSPDGTQIVYTQSPVAGGFGAQGFGDTGIFVAEADGDNAHMISPASPNDTSPDWGVGGPLPTVIWGDNDCSGEDNVFDALAGLYETAGIQVPAPAVIGCPPPGQTLATLAFGQRIWADLDCDGDVDGDDAALLLRDAAGLPPKAIQGCPGLGAPVALAPG